MTISNWVDVSYTKKEGVWEKNVNTGEVRRADSVVPETMEPPIDPPAPVGNFVVDPDPKPVFPWGKHVKPVTAKPKLDHKPKGKNDGA